MCVRVQGMCLWIKQTAQTGLLIERKETEKSIGIPLMTKQGVVVKCERVGVNGLQRRGHLTKEGTPELRQ